MNQKPRKPLHAALVVALDILLGGAILLTFTFFHHVLPRMLPAAQITGPVYTNTPDDEIQKTGNYTGALTAPQIPGIGSTAPETSDRISTESGSLPDTSVEAPQPTEPVYDLSGDFGEKFAPYFAQDDRVYQSENVYQSHDIYMTLHSFDGTLEQQMKKGSDISKTHVVYYVMDVYVRNIENLFCSYQNAYVEADSLYNDTAFGKATAAISGDLFHGYEASKPVIVRNGKVIRKTEYITEDICVLYFDGTMETVTPQEYDWDKIAEKNPYQVWCFGPELIDGDGHAKTGISSAVWRTNPRAAIGFVEPGHYVLACVNGYRDDSEAAEHGVGVNLDVLAKIMEEYGCVSAYNLDGGASVYAYYGDQKLVEISNMGGSKRSISDLICIGEVGGN